MQNKKVLLVDDEKSIRRLIRDFLIKEKCEVLEAEDGEEALKIFHEHGQTLDLIVLDVMMPKKDGYEVLKEIRLSSDIPIIMLTAKTNDEMQIASFNNGVDDYVTKPFSLMVLISRIKNKLKTTNTSLLRHGNLTINVFTRKVFIDNNEVILTYKEFELLLHMLQNKNCALSRNDLISHVWSSDYSGDSRTLDTHIKQLRIKLNNWNGTIETVRGFGYMIPSELI